MRLGKKVKLNNKYKRLNPALSHAFGEEVNSMCLVSSLIHLCASDVNLPGGRPQVLALREQRLELRERVTNFLSAKSNPLPNPYVTSVPTASTSTLGEVSVSPKSVSVSKTNKLNSRSALPRRQKEAVW
jgi:hypothetical protein